MTDTMLETTILDRVADRLFIGGEWVEAEGGRTLAVTDPSTGDTIKEIADASPADGIRALDAAVAAQDAWAATAPRERGELLRRAFD
ncbi:MAG: aldehyde dehydrogenase family protein, partial [Agromyces sp.]|nr:aldehyde dehydrogenase family protein [Agromyces sp.]